MPRKVLLRTLEMEAIQVSAETLEIAASFCGGSIRGVKLPRSKRLIQFRSKITDGEVEAHAEDRDYIVKLAPEMFIVIPDDVFHKLFIDIDPRTH